MQNFLKTVCVSAALAMAGSAHAFTFNEGQNQHFTQYFTVTPDAADKLTLSVSGLTSQFSSLKFEFVGVSGLAVVADAPPVGQTSLKASFSDIRNKFAYTASPTGRTADAVFQLQHQSYLLKVEGDTLASISGGQGTVSLTSLNATVTPVPEPESYAMFLAGLGIMGAVVRRRSNAQA
jgi:hypothetical protein